ncbi:MAG TPA: class I SAM-dependent methyltransferase [Candidatus Saccharimonadales bacterium]|nr:class I SAM-dependent methyltransferase [Candidatus Saccharimonadales bacterium]
MAKAKTLNYDIPYVPSSDQSTGLMIKLANIRPGEKAVDLGAGEGKLVVAMARAGARAIGIEIDKERAEQSRLAILAAGLSERARILNATFWNHDLGPYDLIVLYGVPSIMSRLEKKILTEARPTSRIVSNYFQFPNLLLAKSIDHIHLYRPFV